MTSRIESTILDSLEEKNAQLLCCSISALNIAVTIADNGGHRPAAQEAQLGEAVLDSCIDVYKRQIYGLPVPYTAIAECLQQLCVQQ